MSRKTQEFTVIPKTDSQLLTTTDLIGTKLVALDGEIGHLRDFLFDDNIWVIRYAIVDTGAWLPGRLVLLSPYAFGALDQRERTMQIKLQKRQIQDCPSIEPNKLVTRQDEADFFRHYGWPAYWAGDNMWGASRFPIIGPVALDEQEEPRLYYHRDDKHLQKVQEVVGFPIQTGGGEIGRVKGFTVVRTSWAIREVIVETGPKHANTEIRLATDRVNWISYNDAKVHVNLTKVDVQRLTEPGLATAGGVGHKESHPRQ
jgi:hypothetical protein